MKDVGVVRPDIAVDAANGKVHLAQSPRRVVALLPVDGQVADAATVGQHELLGRQEHTARSATGVIDAALVHAVASRWID